MKRAHLAATQPPSTSVPGSQAARAAKRKAAEQIVPPPRGKLLLKDPWARSKQAAFNKALEHGQSVEAVEILYEEACFQHWLEQAAEDAKLMHTSRPRPVLSEAVKAFLLDKAREAKETDLHGLAKRVLQ